MIKPWLITLASAATLAVAACTAPATTDMTNHPTPTDPAQASIDWSGTYRGDLPCADCEGIRTAVVLSPDGSYQQSMRYLGKSADMVSSQGTFTWDSAGQTIQLDGTEPARYQVDRNQLIRLNQDGSRVSGPLAKHYVLDKIPNGIAGTYWTLTQLGDRAIPDTEQTPYLYLENGQISGFGGCNRFMGSYELDEAKGRVRFGSIMATKMACVGHMDTESGLFQALDQADNFSLADGKLSLNRARMAPLAHFVATPLR